MADAFFTRFAPLDKPANMRNVRTGGYNRASAIVSAALDRAALGNPSMAASTSMIFTKYVQSKHLGRRLFAAAFFAALSGSLTIPAAAQSTTDHKAADQKPAAGDRRESVTKRNNEIAEVGRLISGPAAHPECVWLGRLVISRLWRDDLDTAFRHRDLYDRFGCPGGQIQATFRCLVRLGDFDPKAPDALNGRIHACWINPSVQTPAAGPATAASPPDSGTTAR